MNSQTGRFARVTYPVTGFELVDTAIGAGLPAEPAWLPAVVPEGVHEACCRQADRGPCIDRNETLVSWIEHPTGGSEPPSPRRTRRRTGGFG